MELSTGKMAGLGLALLLAANAYALGLGEVSGRVTLGQPLNVEIPILGSDGAIPAASCFRLQPPLTDVGNDFAVRNARIQVAGDRRGAKLIVSSSAPVREPVVGFAVAAGCGAGLAKDYVLLAGLPADSPPPPTSLPAPELPAAAAVPQAVPVKSAAEKPAAPVAATDVLRIDAALTLEDLARQKYPNQPKAREKFMRMMREANSALAAEGPIAAGMELRLPAGLPVRRFGPYLGEAKAPQQPPTPLAAPAASAPAPAASAEAPKAKAQAASPAKDRLVLGAAPQMNEAKLLEEAERLTTILVEQNKNQDAMTENLAKLEASYGQLQKDFTRLQERLARIEAERQAEKQAATLSVNFFELLLAVLAGGAIGGLALHFYLRQRARRTGAVDAAALHEAPVAAGKEIPVPWAQKPAAPAASVPASAPMAAAGVASVATAALVAEAASTVAAETPVRAPSPIDAALAAMAAEEAEPPAVEVEPTAAVEVLPAEVPAAAPVVAETTTPADDLDALSLDFPLLPEDPPPAAPEAPALELPALAAAEASPAAVAEAPPAQEMLTLDFPEIPKASAAAEDGHVIDFDPTAKDDLLDFSKR